MPKATDPRTGVALNVPSKLVSRYKEKGYKVTGKDKPEANKGDAGSKE